MEHYIRFISRYYRWILIALIMITGVMGWYATKLQTNATPYFLDKEHPSRVADRHLKELFKGSGEVMIVTTETKEESIFNPKSLRDIYNFTHAVESLTLTDENDVKKLQEIMATSRIDQDLWEPLKGIKKFRPSDYTAIKVINNAIDHSHYVTEEEKQFVEELLIRVWPVEKVRGLVGIESITADDENSFDIHALMPRLLMNDNEIKKLEQEAHGNKLLEDILFTDSNKKVANTLIELRIPQDDAPNMKRIYDGIVELPVSMGMRDTYYISGPPAIFAQTATVVKANSDKMFPFVIMMVLLMLYLLYRSKRTMVIPVIVAILSVVWTLGTMAYFGYKQNIVSTIIPVFLISIGVSDTIHFLSEYHKLTSGDRVHKVQHVLGKTFKPMLFTSLTTMVGFLSLMYTPISFIFEFGLFVALGIVYAFVITVSLVPALQLMFDTKEEAYASETFLTRTGGYLEEKIVRVIATRKTAVWIGILLIMIVSFLGIERLKIDNEMIEYFSSESRVYKDTKFINKNFGGSSTVEFTLSHEREGYFKEKENVVHLDEAISQIKEIENVGTVYALPNFIKLMNKGLHADKPEYFALPEEEEAYPQYLFLYESSNGNEIFNIVNEDYTQSRVVIFTKSDRTSSMDRIVEEAKKDLEHALPGVKVTPSGFGEVLISTRNEVVFGQISSLLISFVVIFFFLLILFRNSVLALFGMVPLMMTVIINFGLMGWFGLYLDVGSAIVAPIAIGIGVDNAIYYISYYLREKSDEARSIAATKRVFGALYANSLVLGSGFLILVLAEHQSLVNLGWLVSATVVVSAIVTLLVLPLLFQKFHVKA